MSLTFLARLACFARYFDMNTYHISVCKQCNIYIVELIKLQGSSKSKAAPQYRCFSLAQCFLQWWGKPGRNTEHCAVIGSVFCHSWRHYITAKSKGSDQKFKPGGCCHIDTLEVPIQEGSRSLATDTIKLYLQ